MKYTDTEFLALIAQVESHGGTYLSDVHEPTEEIVQRMQQARDGSFELTGKRIRMRLGGCGEQALFELPYTDLKGKKAKHLFCAVCDNLREIARLQEADDGL